MAISCGAAIVKYLLFALNFIILVLGAGVIYFGVIVLLKYNNDISNIVKETPHYAAIVLLAAGACIFVFAFLGCCGAIKESFGMLMAYAILIMICLGAQAVGGYFIFKYHTSYENYVVDGIKSAMHAYRINKTADDPANRAINEFQKLLHCCGANSYKDWDPIINNKQLSVISLFKPNDYPPSCCKRPVDADSTGNCPGDRVIKKGCVEAMKELINTSLGGLTYLSISIVLIQLLILISTCWLAREAHVKYSSYGQPRTAKA